jgi:hypothetical protein
MRTYRLLGVFLAGCLLALSELLFAPRFAMTIAQSTPPQLYYLYQGEQVPLDLRQDAIAVESSARERSGEPFYLRLRQQLQPEGPTRGDGSTNPPGMEINPLGETTAMVTLSSHGPRSLAEFSATSSRISPIRFYPC